MENSTELYTVMRTTDGLEEHSTDLTYNQAEELIKDLEVFEDETYEIHPQPEPTVIKDRIKSAPRGAADGWEDIYNY